MFLMRPIILLLFSISLTYTPLCLAESISYEPGVSVYNLYKIKIYDRPAFEGNLIKSYSPGSRFKIIKKEGSWYQVKTPNDKVGYVAEAWITKSQNKVKEQLEREASNKANDMQNTKERYEKLEIIKAEWAKKQQIRKDRYDKFRKKHITWSNEVCKAVWQREIMIGMTKEQLFASWGSPDRKNRTVTANHVNEQWIYSGNRRVYFQDGILTSWQDQY